MVRLEFTKEEFRVLLEALHVAGWVRNAHVEGLDYKGWPSYGVEQKVYAMAKEAGCGDLVEGDPRSGDIFPTNKLDEIGHEIIDGHDEEAFWEGLIERLAERDIERAKGAGALERMKGEDRVDAMEVAEEKYRKEFAARGLDRLDLPK